MKINKIASILLSLVIAVALWFYVVSSVTPDDSQWIYNIPVTFTNEDGLFSDRNLVLTEGRDATVDLRLAGKRQDLLKLSSSNITVTADLSQVTASGDWRLRYDIEYPDTVSSSDISVEKRSSYYVNITVDKLDTNEVEVRAVFRGDVAEGYVQEPIKLEYDTIEISGPKDLVRTVAYAQVVLERTNLTKSVSDVLSYTLMDADGEPVESDEIKCSVDKIGVEMPVFMVKEVPLRVDLSEGGGATAENAIVSCDPSTVTIKGDPEDLEGLNSILLGTVDLASIQTSAKKSFNIIIPDGMTNLTGADTATVTVELKNLKTKAFQVTNIECTNYSDDYRVILGTTVIQVQVRGVEDEIDQLVASNIRAVADLSTVSSATGQYLVPVTIYVDGFADVGAMGSYSVLVTISDAAETTTTAVEVTTAAAASDSETETEDETG
jgi:hypothetical protein